MTKGTSGRYEVHGRSCWEKVRGIYGRDDRDDVGCGDSGALCCLLRSSTMKIGPTESATPSLDSQDTRQGYQTVAPWLVRWRPNIPHMFTLWLLLRCRIGVGQGVALVHHRLLPQLSDPMVAIRCRLPTRRREDLSNADDPSCSSTTQLQHSQWLSNGSTRPFILSCRVNIQFIFPCSYLRRPVLLLRHLRQKPIRLYRRLEVLQHQQLHVPLRLIRRRPHVRQKNHVLGLQ